MNDLFNIVPPAAMSEERLRAELARVERTIAWNPDLGPTLEPYRDELMAEAQRRQPQQAA